MALTVLSIGLMVVGMQIEDPTTAKARYASAVATGKSRSEVEHARRMLALANAKAAVERHLGPISPLSPDEARAVRELLA